MKVRVNRWKNIDVKKGQMRYDVRRQNRGAYMKPSDPGKVGPVKISNRL
jgi:hypothetical protein